MKGELATLDATAQAELVRRGEVQPIELVDAAIARIEQVNPRLNAVITPTFEKARAQARGALPDGPFRGVPFLLKDLGAHSAGDPFHGGMRLLRDAGWVAPHDTYLAAKLRAAGFVFLGKTNTPELGLLPTTEPDAYGATHNPWDPTRSPGGSSGGSGAAVASGMVPVAHATDGGGSIRIPASHCGLVGLKPSRGRVSFGPDAGERWGGFSCENSVTRSIRDAAAILDVLAGVMPGDPYAAPSPLRPFVAEVGADPGRLRVGLMTTSPAGTPLHPACVAAAEEGARLLRELGHTVEVSYPEALGNNEATRAFVTVIACSVARALDLWGEKLGRTVSAGDVEPLTWAVSELGRQASARDYLRAVEFVHTQGRRLAGWWQDGHDLLLRRLPSRLRSWASSRRPPTIPSPASCGPLRSAPSPRRSTCRDSRRSRCRSFGLRTTCRSACTWLLLTDARTSCFVLRHSSSKPSHGRIADRRSTAVPRSGTAVPTRRLRRCRSRRSRSAASVPRRSAIAPWRQRCQACAPVECR